MNESRELGYREPADTDLSPELRARLHEAGLPTRRAQIAAAAGETPATVERLIRGTKMSLSRQLFRWTYRLRGDAACRLADIPQRARVAAAALGFRPVAWVRHGPIFTLRTPNFVGPEGFVKLEVFGGERVYLFSYLDDGTSVETAPGAAMNARTTVLKGTDDLEADYAAHVAKVLELMRARGCQPLGLSSREALLAEYRLFPVLFMPEAACVMQLVAIVGLVAMVVVALLAVVNR